MAVNYDLHNTGAEVQERIDLVPVTAAELNTERQERIAATESEADARDSADNTLQGNIDTEAQARQQSDATLQENIVAEGTRARSAEGTLQNNIDGEEARAIGVEQALQGNINSEAQARHQADATLQGNIDTEAQARHQADAGLQDNIDTEAQARQQADVTLQGNIDVEAQARIAAIDEIDEKIPASASAQNKLVDEVSVSNAIASATADFVTASVNNLINYYLKSETYTREEVQQIIDSIKQFNYQSVPELPVASASTKGIIYLVPSADPQSENVKDEYITVYHTNEMGVTYYTWEQIGSTSINLDDYYTKTQADAALNSALEDYSTTTQMNTAIEDAIEDLDLSDTYDAKGAAESVVGNASEDYNTLAKIEKKLLPVEEASGDKAYEAGSGKGLGRKNLPLNSIGNKNLLSQSMINQANTVYVIQNDYEIGSDGSVDLRVDPISVTIGGVNYYCKEVSLNAGETILLTTTGSAKIIINDGGSWVLYQFNYYTAQSNTTIRLGAVPTSQTSVINYVKTGGSITIPANCTLKFDGGSISGGTLVANNATIEGIPSFKGMTDIQGVFKMDVAHAENFGFGGDDDTKLLGFLFDMAASGVDVVLEEGHQYLTNVRDWYRTTNTYTVPSDWGIIGTTNGSVNLSNTTTIGGTSYKYGLVDDSILQPNRKLTITSQQYSSGVRIARKGSDGTWYIDRECIATIDANSRHMTVGVDEYIYKDFQVFGVHTAKIVTSGAVLLRKEGSTWTIVSGGVYTSSESETLRVAVLDNSGISTISYTVDTGTTHVTRKPDSIRLCAPQSSGISSVSYKYSFTNPGFYDDGHAIRFYNNLSKFYFDGNGATILMSTDKTFMGKYACPKLLRFCDCSNVTIKNVTLIGDVCQIAAPGGYGVEPIFVAGDATNYYIDVKGKHLRQPFCYGTYEAGSLSEKGMFKSTVVVDVEDCGYGMEINGATDSTFKINFNIGHRGIYIAAANNCSVTSIGKNVNTMAAILLHATFMKRDSEYVMIGSSNNNLAIEDTGTYECTQEIATDEYASEGIGIVNRYPGDNTGSGANPYASYTCATAVFLSCGCYNGVIDDYLFERDNVVMFTGNTLKHTVHEECRNYSVYPTDVGPLEDRDSPGYIWDTNYAPYTTWEMKVDAEVRRPLGWAEWNKNHNGHTDNNYNVALSVYGNNDMPVTIDGRFETNDDESYYVVSLPPANNKRIKLSSSTMRMKFDPWVTADSLKRRTSVNDSASLHFDGCKEVYVVPLGTTTTYDTSAAKYTNLTVRANSLTNNSRYPINVKTSESQLKSVPEHVTVYKDISNVPGWSTLISSSAMYGVQPYQVYDFVVYTSVNKTIQLSSELTLKGNACGVMVLPAGSHKFLVYTTLENNNVKINVEFNEILPWNSVITRQALYAQFIKDGELVYWDGATYRSADGEEAGATEGKRYVGDFSAEEFVTNAVQSAKLGNLFNAFKAGKECYVPQKNEQNQDLGYVKLVFDYATTTTIKYTFNYDGRLVGGVLTNNNGTYTNNITILLAYTIGSSGAGINVLNASSTTPADGKILKVKNVGDNNLRVEWDNA